MSVERVLGAVVMVAAGLPVAAAIFWIAYHWEEEPR